MIAVAIVLGIFAVAVGCVAAGLLALSVVAHRGPFERVGRS